MENTRQEHLEWCKTRALEYVDSGDLEEAFASFLSDVGKHPGTEAICITIGSLGLPLLMEGFLSTPQKMRDHIQGYN